MMDEIQVTILILVDGFLQSRLYSLIKELIMSHNPYFSRWFSAITYQEKTLLKKIKGHNPYFSRWFSAIYVALIQAVLKT